MDKIFIRDLTAETTIGIFDYERDIRQKVIIDLEMEVDASIAASTDSISDALDYSQISQELLAHIEASDCFLIETLAEELAVIILERFKVAWVKLRLTKPEALITASGVGVLIERSR
tara:strand:+ start:155 stop:505 length:351 start_codon:yes stop_codon:yes gene_type:complete